jgi:hypothetical protein
MNAMLSLTFVINLIPRDDYTFHIHEISNYDF